MQDSPVLPAIDPLGEALHFLRMSGAFYTRCELTEPWGLALPLMRQWLMFHVVTTGRCWLEAGKARPRELRSGELALVPHGDGHKLTSELGVATAELFALPREAISERYEVLRLGGGGTPATLICGAVRFDHPAAQQLITLLPRIICIEAAGSPDMHWLQSTLRFMASEARELRPGGETVITRLADIVVIQAIRAWMEQDPAAQTGWLGALRDKQIGRAIALIHRDPAHDWTLAALANAVAMSRSAFAARFTELAGMPAMQYVTRWRMQLAASWLKESDAPLADIAARAGYQSEAAFNRAFKKFSGVSPGMARQSLTLPSADLKGS